MKRNIYLAMAFLMSTACTNEWRTGDPQLSAADMLQMLADAGGTTSQSTSGGDSAIQLAMTMKDQAGTTIFFADAPSAMGPVASVLALNDLNFLGTGTDLYYGNIAAARVFFLDDPSTGQDVLIIGIGQAVAAPAPAPASAPTPTSTSVGTPFVRAMDAPATATGASYQYTYTGFQGSGSVNDGTFAARLSADNGNWVTVRSDDVGKSGTLNAVIQLRVYEDDGSGNEVFIGKISTLSGYQ